MAFHTLFGGGVAAALMAASGLTLPATAMPWPIGVAPDQRSYPSSPVPPPNPWAYGDRISDGADAVPPEGSSPYGTSPYGTSPYGAVPDAAQPLTPMQMAQRCNTGRLVGGLLGGGLGYGLSRKDGRAWAIPLGALLGSQMGCSAAVGRGPRPW